MWPCMIPKTGMRGFLITNANNVPFHKVQWNKITTPKGTKSETSLSWQASLRPENQVDLHEF